MFRVVTHKGKIHRCCSDIKCKKHITTSIIIIIHYNSKSRQKEITLNCHSPELQLRVISVHSWYLTSFCLPAAFYRFFWYFFIWLQLSAFLFLFSFRRKLPLLEFLSSYKYHYFGLYFCFKPSGVLPVHRYHLSFVYILAYNFRNIKTQYCTKLTKFYC